jgi:hypothetical protein
MGVMSFSFPDMGAPPGYKILFTKSFYLGFEHSHLSMHQIKTKKHVKSHNSHLEELLNWGPMMERNL